MGQEENENENEKKDEEKTVILLPLVNLVDSKNRKIGRFSDEASFLDQLKEKNTSDKVTAEEGLEEEKCHVIGESLLHIAIIYDCLDSVKYLVEIKKMNVNQRTTSGKFINGFEAKETAKLIQESDYDTLAYYGEYPLCFAALFASREIYDYLVEKGADPNLKGILKIHFYALLLFLNLKYFF
jgi:hypothetical protein